MNDHLGIDAPGGPAQHPAPFTWTPPPQTHDAWWSPPAQQSQRPRRASRRLPVFACAVVAGAALGAAAGAGALTSRQATTSSTSSPTAPQDSAADPALGGGSSTPVPAGGGDSASPPSTGVLDATSIATKVDAAVVDVTSILPQQGAVAEGTGMVITSSGEVLTNNHVIDGATRITVKIGGSGRAYTAKVLGADAGEDIALLQIEGVSGLQTVTIGESSAVTVGDAVVAIGNALGRGGTPLATQGVVTSLDRTITASDSTGGRETLSGLIEINALIEPGDSGGPLVDSSGDVIGINTAAEVGGRFMRQTRSTAGFAIPISTAMSIVHQIEASSRV